MNKFINTFFYDCIRHLKIILETKKKKPASEIYEKERALLAKSDDCCCPLMSTYTPQHRRYFPAHQAWQSESHPWAIHVRQRSGFHMCVMAHSQMYTEQYK